MHRNRRSPAVVARLVVAFPLMTLLCFAEAFATAGLGWDEGGKFIERRALNPLSDWVAGDA